MRSDVLRLLARRGRECRLRLGLDIRARNRKRGGEAREVYPPALAAAGIVLRVRSAASPGSAVTWSRPNLVRRSVRLERVGPVRPCRSSGQRRVQVLHQQQAQEGRRHRRCQLLNQVLSTSGSRARGHSRSHSLHDPSLTGRNFATEQHRHLLPRDCCAADRTPLPRSSGVSNPLVELLHRLLSVEFQRISLGAVHLQAAGHRRVSDMTLQLLPLSR